MVHRLRIGLGESLPRALDIAVATLGLLVLSPVLLLRGVAARLRHGRMFDRSVVRGRHGVVFERLAFAGPGFGRPLAALFNLLKGDLALVGPRPRALDTLSLEAGAETAVRTTVRPGLVSPFTVRRRAGIAYESEAETDSEFVHHPAGGSGATLLLRALIGRLITGNGDRPEHEQLCFFGVNMANTTMDETLEWLSDRARERKPTLLAFVNPDCLNIAHGDAGYREILRRAERVLPDGIGINIGCRVQGLSLKANLNGTDLFPRLCEKLAETGQSLYLLGAKPGRAAATAKAMQAAFPNLRVAGTRHGYFDETEEAAVIEEINGSGADFLLVAMGAPRQESWLARHGDTLRVPVRMGVGGLFDFYSGSIPRAPVWMREVGLEWSWRLLQEPRRMWRRYLVGNPLFLYRVWRERRKGETATLDRLPRGLNNGRFDLFRNRVAAASRRGLWRFMSRLTEGVKRLLDIVVSAVALLLLLPLFLLVALAIRLESPGPVFFRQTRVGALGRTFTMWKFRSMYTDAEARKAELEARNEMQGGVLFKMKDDPRVTRVGRLIRRLSIDELPQLWNVLSGDMSLVGPRPALPREVSQYSLEERGRLDAKPGITCTWQVSGRSDIPFDEQVVLDIDYIRRLSVGQDLKLLAKTVPAVLSGRGAY